MNSELKSASSVKTGKNFAKSNENAVKFEKKIR